MTALSLVLAVGAAPGPATAAGPSPDGAAPSDCAQTWTDLGVGAPASLLTAARFADGATWAVGVTSEGSGRRRPLVIRHEGDTSTRVRVRARSEETGLYGVDVSRTGLAWAAGYRTWNRVYRPYLLRGDASGMTRVDLPTRAAGSLTSVTAPGGGVVAVGFSTPVAGEVPLIVRRESGAWAVRRLPVPLGRAASLLAVDGHSPTDVWAGGWVLRAVTEAPYLLRWDGLRWSAMGVEGLASSGAILAIDSVSDDLAWAVGYRRVETRMRPLIGRWDGQAWSTVPSPDVGSPLGVLTGVASIPGGVVVSGNLWDEVSGAWTGFAARWDGTAWAVDRPSAGATSLAFRDAAVGDDPAVATLVGSLGASGLAAAWCPEAPDASVIDPPPTAAPARRPSTDRPRTVGRVGPDRPSVPIPTARLVARDVGPEVGLGMRTLTHGGTIADLDGDGVKDLFLSRHSRPALLAINDEGVFRTPVGVSFPGADRHGCDAADVDADGDTDLYCALGAHRGAGLKINELWLREDDGSYTQAGATSGAADPLGRARAAVFFDLDHDRLPDLFVANKTPRTDGLPGPSVLFTRGDAAAFRATRTDGIDASMGADCLRPADLDGDGWEDLVACRKNLNGDEGYGIAWLRNERGVLRDRTDWLGLRQRLAVDVLPVDLDGDGRLDLVEMTPWQLWVHLRRGTGYVTVATELLFQGRNLAAGDVNADGTPDLYVVQGTDGENPRDRLFLVRAGGASLERVMLPGTREGQGDVALPIDHDGNGLMDFVVLNGADKPGPIELIAFFRE